MQLLPGGFEFSYFHFKFLPFDPKSLNAVMQQCVLACLFSPKHGHHKCCTDMAGIFHELLCYAWLIESLLKNDCCIQNTKMVLPFNGVI